MKIRDVEISPIVMPKEDPKWRFALSSEAKARGFLVKLISSDGWVGLGYTGTAAHHGATYGGVQAALESYIDHLVGQDPFDTEKILGALEKTLKGNNEAAAAVDIALHDLQARALGLPLYALLGGLVREEVPLIRVLGLKEPAQMAANALKLVDQGYRYVKVKLSGDPAIDLNRVREIRNGVGQAVHLTVDANQTYSPKVAIETLSRMEEWGVERCEQPVRKDDREGLAAVTRAVHCLVEAHESALKLEQVYDLVKGRIVDGIYLDVNRIGGLRKAKEAAAICRLGNVSLRIGATGSRILAAASLHLAASTENISYACQVAEFARLLNDPAEGLEIVNGTVRVPSTPGLGVTLRPAPAAEAG